MSQRVQNTTWPKFMIAVGVIVAAQILSTAIGTGVGAYLANRVDLPLCLTNQRIDRLEYPKIAPRECK